jgi:hypothetical protein
MLGIYQAFTGLSFAAAGCLAGCILGGFCASLMGQQLGPSRPTASGVSIPSESDSTVAMFAFLGCVLGLCYGL